MTEVRRPGRDPHLARHEMPLIDELALIAARAGDLVLAAADERRAERWSRELSNVAEQLRDGTLADVRRAAIRARSAFGPKDSIRDALPPEVIEPFLKATDRLIRELARHNRSR